MNVDRGGDTGIRAFVWSCCTRLRLARFSRRATLHALMRRLQLIHIEAQDPRRFEPIISPEEYQDLRALIDHDANALRGRVIWNVNSTAGGGVVAELLRSLLGYSRGAGVDARWLVVTGGPAFFDLTKRIHNQLHGSDGDGRGLSEAERATYEATLAENAAELVPMSSGVL